MHLAKGIAEEDIIAHCRTGSLKHQEMLYKLFYGYAMGIGLRYCLQRDDALEVVNDAFIKIFKNFKSFDEKSAFKPWLRTIIVNTAIDRRRKDLKLQLNTALDQAEYISAGTTAIDSLNAKDILDMMKQLPLTQHTIFNLYEIDGYSHDEIAGMLGISASSSRVYLSRAKEKLRELILIQKQNG